MSFFNIFQVYPPIIIQIYSPFDCSSFHPQPAMVTVLPSKWVLKPSTWASGRHNGRTYLVHLMGVSSSKRAISSMYFCRRRTRVLFRYISATFHSMIHIYLKIYLGEVLVVEYLSDLQDLLRRMRLFLDKVVFSKHHRYKLNRASIRREIEI